MKAAKKGRRCCFLSYVSCDEHKQADNKANHRYHPSDPLHSNVSQHCRRHKSQHSGSAAHHLDWLLRIWFICFLPEQVLRGIHVIVIVHPQKHRQVASSTPVSNDGRRRRWQANIGFGGAGFAWWGSRCGEYARVVGGVGGRGWARRRGRKGWGDEKEGGNWKMH